jgi:tetratricopeptide (TPR) repeat protein
VPHALEAVIRRSLAPDPRSRYAEAKALAGDLRRYLARERTVEAPNPSTRERAAYFLLRHRIALASFAAGALVALTAAAALRESPSEAAARAGSEQLTYGSDAAARDEFKKALADSPSDPGPVRGLIEATRGLASRALGDDEAPKNLNDAIGNAQEFRRLLSQARRLGYRLVPADAPEMGRAASFLAMSPDPVDHQDARVLASEAEELDGRLWRVHQVLGSFEARDGDPDGAYAAFGRAIDLAGSSDLTRRHQVLATLWGQRIGAAIAAGRLHEAEAGLAEARRLNDPDQFRPGDFEKTRAHLEFLGARILIAHAESADPESAGPLIEGAREHLRKALEIDPRYDPAHKLLRFLDGIDAR